MTARLAPTDDRVFVKPLIDEGKLPGSDLLRPLANTISREGVLLHAEGDEKFINQGVVVALGRGIASKHGAYHVVAIGDHVIFSPYAASHITIAGDTLLVVREPDIEAIVEGD